jgi:hypothetical protein
MAIDASAAIDDAAHQKQFVIVVNGEQTTVESKDVTYERLVALAFPTPPDPDTIYTVTYRKAQKPHEGSLVEGQSVEVKKKGTVFNVFPTGRS